ncbi:MAG: VWA domain-containing protein [Desulfobacteraceae bacterium]|nr:VWA domain-containing protein [Deltaproteobacteria bacterium]MBL6979144.1 VWA domain-containing protein [Desulfobacteraceae bacterium]
MVLESNIKKSIKKPKSKKNSVQEFLNEHPHILSELPKAKQDVYLKICSSISHLRSRKSREFFLKTFKNMEALKESPIIDLILGRASILSAFNWALVLPYFHAVEALPQEGAFIERWTFFTRYLAGWDIDVAISFLNQTPKAIETFGADGLFAWGEQALDAVRSGRQMWKAARAYLEETVADHCAIPQSVWKFYLRQAALISEVSPSASEAFIRFGTRVCMLLKDQETERWVSEGMADCGSEEELIKYFSGTSLRALEKRDGLASGIILKDRKNTLSLICEAYLGQPVKIRSNTSLIGVKGFSGGAGTDGRTIYLPDVVPDFRLFKLMALHQSTLLNSAEWMKEPLKRAAELVKTHLDADRRLLERLPGLLKDMEFLLEGGLPSSYPSGASEDFSLYMPWWGDILPELVRETESTIQRLKERSEDQSDLPPEVVEALLSAMMAEGQRDVEGLWKRLSEMFESIVLTSPDPEELQENVKTFFYREWDDGLSDYKLDWCLVRQRLVNNDPNTFVEDVRTRLHGIISLIRRQFMRLKPERFQKFRAQPTGDGLDIDALVQAFVDMRSGSFLSENVYIRRDKRIRDVAVLFLLDMSGSTEEKVNGRRVIDIQKEAMVLMAEALDSLQDPYAIFGFSSDGRFRVDLFTIKDFGEPYGEETHYRLGNLEPKDLTRLGAVIRHGIYKLEGIQATVKLMVILTDGRPYDLEYGNLDYAIADTKKAVQEARRQRIHPFIITSDKKGADYLKRISPETQSIILPKVELLPTMLPAIYKRLTV